MTGRKERKIKIQLCLWDSNPQPLAYMDKGTLPLVLRGSLKWYNYRPRKWFLSCGRALLALLSGREQISTDGRVRKYSNAGYSVNHAIILIPRPWFQIHFISR